MAVTFKELAWLQDSDRVEGIYTGGVAMCPSFYGYEKKEEAPCANKKCACGQCWNRVVPRSVIAEAVQDVEYGFSAEKGDTFLVKNVHIEFGDIEIGPGYSIGRIKNKFKFYIESEEKNMGKYKVGDYVRVRNWDDMEKEFGLDSDGYIKCDACFTKSMREYCGNVYKIVGTVGENRSLYRLWGCGCSIFTDDMIYPEDFRREDLKDGMVVEYRDGRRRMVMDEHFVGVSGYTSVATHRDDLTWADHDIDVMRVYERPAINTFERMLENPGKLIWERKDVPEVIEISAEEAQEKLKDQYSGKTVKIVM